jgi:electron transport complex protein RnfD
MLNNSPFVLRPASVRSVMVRVLFALIPGIAVYVYWLGPAILIQLVLASFTALAAEALVLHLRQRPLGLYLGDASALVTAWLVALSLPATVPWWITVLGVLVAIIVAKHLYGGLGQNPFNPAMVAFALLIVAYPLLLSQWLATPDWASSLRAIFGDRQLDAMASATPLDALRTAIASATANGTTASAAEVGVSWTAPWPWIGLAYALGGLYLWQQRLISWHLPAAFLGTLTLLAGGFHLFDPQQHAAASFHLFSGGTLLAAFFIITDPVSGCTTPRGKLIFGAGAALLVWVIRSFGAYPDGIAFAVLLMNIAAPLIDMKTQPAVFGHKRGRSGREAAP